MKDKTQFCYCKSLGKKINPEYPQFKKNYCKKGYETCYNTSKCVDFKYSWFKSFKRFFFLRRLWLEKWYDIYKFRFKYLYFKKR